MNKQLILETVRSWADNRFTDAASKREVLERNTPPPSVDIRAGLAVAPNDSSGVFFFLQADENKSLQVWLSSEGLANAYAFIDDENDEEQHILQFPQPASPEELTAKLSEIVDRFMRTLIFEPALDEWVGDNGGVYDFEQLNEFCGDACFIVVNLKAWTFFRYTWPGSEEFEVIAGFDGCGNAATFYQPDVSNGGFNFDERISGLQNASQFRNWLDKAVARPVKMSIHEISVSKLFEKLTYTIPLKSNYGATIIHAPNGCGKTTLFRLVNALLNAKFDELALTRFESLALCFDDGRRLVINQLHKIEDPEIFEAQRRRRKRHDGLVRSSSETGAPDGRFSTSAPCSGLIAKLYDDKNNLLKKDIITADMPERDSTTHLRSLAQRIARREPSLRNSPNGAFDISTGEFLSHLQIMERYSRPRFSEPKPWLLNLIARNEVFFIQTDRLKAEVSEDLTGGGPLELISIPAVLEYAKQIQVFINKAITDFSRISQKLDREFPQKLIDALKRDAPDFKTVFLDDVEKKFRRLVAAGILDTSEAQSLRTVSQKEASDPTLRCVLSLYTENQSQKLCVFNELLSKIETLKKVINERLQMKKLEVSFSQGYRIVSEDGTPIPLHRLSSGEQHQIALFHSLIFGMRPGALIMIDEPEISLHVAWQEIFLRDLELISKSSGVHFLIATHSPYIIGNRWKQTVSLGEQIQEVV